MLDQDVGVVNFAPTFPIDVHRDGLLVFLVNVSHIFRSIVLLIFKMSTKGKKRVNQGKYVAERKR